MDPWRDCERIFDNHFMDRMKEKHLPYDQVEEALIVGDKIVEEKNEYAVRWHRWTLKVSLRQCFIYLHTAYLG